MCGRFTLRKPLTVLAKEFSFDLGRVLPGIEPRYNIGPTQEVAAVRVAEPGGPRQLAMLRWGLIPSWAKDAKIAYSTINARADTAATKPAFRAAFKKRRCLVLADGYFEWEAQGKAKLPWLYEVDSGEPFAFAGLWEQWWGQGEDKPPLETCTILTTEPNELAAVFHDRMPVILDSEDYDAWLSDVSRAKRGRCGKTLIDSNQQGRHRSKRVRLARKCQPNPVQGVRSFLLHDNFGQPGRRGEFSAWRQAKPDRPVRQSRDPKRDDE